jgi:hypothetical protein
MGVASSAVEHSAFNRLVSGSNPGRPIFNFTEFRLSNSKLSKLKAIVRNAEFVLLPRVSE